MEIQKQTQMGVIMSIEEHNNLVSEVNRLKESVKNLEQQLNIKNNIQLYRITEDEMIDLIYDDSLTLEKVKQWDLQGGDLLIKDDDENTILHSASWIGQLDIIEYIISKGVDVDSLNYCNQTPLMYACNGQIEVINFLLERGANINHQNNWGWSALHFACNWNQLEAVKVLVDRGIDIHLKYGDNKTALDKAKQFNHQEIVDYLKSVIKERLKTDYDNKLRELENKNPVFKNGVFI